MSSGQGHAHPNGQNDGCARPGLGPLPLLFGQNGRLCGQSYFEDCARNRVSAQKRARDGGWFPSGEDDLRAGMRLCSTLFTPFTLSPFFALFPASRQSSPTRSYGSTLAPLIPSQCASHIQSVIKISVSYYYQYTISCHSSTLHLPLRSGSRAVGLHRIGG